MFDIREVDLHKLNSLTKYPSIFTYHALGDKGVLRDEVRIPFAGRMIGSEKVDGTNTRIICCPDGSVLLGSREDLLWERRDLIGNSAMGIVELLKETVNRLAPVICEPDQIAVYYVELYGRNIGAGAKNYSRTGNAGFRLFDAMFIENFGELLAWPADKLALWRDQGGQPFVHHDRLQDLAMRLGLQPVPALFDLDATQLPTDLPGMYEFLVSFGQTRCPLDDEAQGVPEGIVVRSPDRARIAKIRREDYERTLKRRPKK
ncbi:hypothetical protein ETAA8_20820 [Anatilimnocola aggregata]|uniref:RNA ligase domain-containing protein n=1 Tax=Anatilimnocola aggregata TaxID=2528021 RepID=A0A517Y9V5_9BACT|nr:RNA ligase family protein [Anatilimnocola aggregata]QDU26998.1 hypothetical protein ETAA8_20820 [Anatilimnocola aggregata]